MKQQRMLLSTAVAVALGLVVSAASAQTTISPGKQATGTAPAGMNNPAAPDNTMTANEPNRSFSSWTTDYSKKHEGRISRQAYMDESGRRWDAMDKNHQGLTSDDVNRMYGWDTASSTGNNAKNKDNKGQ